MLQSQKYVFLNAFVIAAFIFASGLLIGFMLENSRIGKIDSILAESEQDILDARIQNDIYSFSDINCSRAIQENINFANKIYEEAKLLYKYENANRLSETITMQHRRYDLLRTMFWVNSIKIKEKCNNSIHTIAYLYDYNGPRLDIKAKQSVFSRILEELKNKMGNDIMLIPMAGDNNLSSTNLLMNLYNISESELPVILIDEKTKITELEGIEELEKQI